MNSPPVLRGFVYATVVCALAVAALIGAFGFEEPNDALVGVAAGLLLVAILAVLVHLGLDVRLTGAQKRVWFRELTGRRALTALAEYLTSDDPAASATRIAEHARRRRNQSSALHSMADRESTARASAELKSALHPGRIVNRPHERRRN